MGSDGKAFRLIHFVNRPRKHLSDSGKRSLNITCKLNLLSTLSRNKQYIIKPVHTECLGGELDVKGVCPGWKSEVSRGKSPFAVLGVLDTSEIIFNGRRPSLSVSGESDFEVRFEERIGTTLGITLGAERELEVLGRNGDVPDDKIIRRSL